MTSDCAPLPMAPETSMRGVEAVLGVHAPECTSRRRVVPSPRSPAYMSSGALALRSSSRLP